MSEPLLRAIIELFAIVAKEDDVTQSERDSIEEFLLDHLNENKAKEYISQFDEAANRILTSSGPKRDEFRDIEKICAHINLELTFQQKVILILNLVELILADGYISEMEDKLVNKIGEEFNINKSDIDTITRFLQGKTKEELASEKVLIVDGSPDSEQPLHIQKEGLRGFMAFLYLPSSGFYFVKYLGNMDIFLNGIPLRPEKVRVFSLGSTIRAHHLEPVFYSDIIGSFHTPEYETNIAFKAEKIWYKFRNGKIGLRDIEIEEKSGHLVGLMGASGAGKSTLLNVLNGSEVPYKGSVTINGIDIHKDPDKIEGVIGFVPQDDLLIEELTVYQNLYYSAKLCFANLSEEEIDKLVLRTISNLGLSETKDLKVGSPLEKTISGGQRKRLNIGLELLREPAILFVDEPTSGLSSRDSENIMDLLKELALRGKLIFVVIHQPSSDIFKMFDKLVILDVGGYQIFYGNPIEAIIYFKEIVKMVNSEEGECIECGNVNPEQIFQIIETKVVDEYGHITQERKITPQQWHRYYKKMISVEQMKEVTDQIKPSIKIPNRLKQIKLFSIRDILTKISNKQYLIINLLEAPILAFILAYIVRYAHSDMAGGAYVFGKNVNIPAYLFMSIIVALFMGLTVSAEEIIRDAKILKREAFLNLSRGSYLSSKVFILFTISAFQTFTFVLVGNSILEIREMLLVHWAILFTVSSFANLLGLNISSAFNKAVTIYILIPILLIPQLILSGVVVSFDNLNPRLSNQDKVPFVGDLMASRWAYEAAMVTQFKDNKFQKIFYEYDKTMGNAEYKKSYYIPKLETKLDFCNTYFKSSDPELKNELAANLELLRYEIGKELDLVGRDKLDISKLFPNTIDAESIQNTKQFLDILKKFYSNQFNKANNEKDQLVSSLVDEPEKRREFEELKYDYQNDRIAQVVKNVADPERIVEQNGELVRKIYPIFYQPGNNRSIIDFRTPFYVPVKPFLGRNYDTLNFNLSVIWFMTIFLCISLYYDWLRKILNTFSNLPTIFESKS